MISALAPDRPDQAFNIAVLPGCTDRGGPVPDAHRPHPCLEDASKCSVIIANEIFRRAVPGKRLGDLPRKPLGCRVSGHRGPQQPSSSVAKNKKCVELFEGDRRDHKQINRCNPLGVIAKERLPALRWPIPPGHHVDRNRRLGDLKAQSEQLAMDPGRSPQRVLKAHSSNEVAQFLADPRSAPRGAGLPSPVSGKTHSMPAHDGLRSDNGYGVKNARTATIEPNEQGTAGPVQMHPAWRALLQDIELMPQDQDFSFEPLARLEAVAQHADEKKGNCHHRPGSCSDSVRAATQADGVFGSDRYQYPDSIPAFLHSLRFDCFASSP